MRLIVIDMQKALVVDELFNKERVLKSIVRLINAARKKKAEVIYVQHDAGSGTGFSQGDEGFEIVDEIKPLDSEKVFVKTINSAFGNRDFSKYLEETGDNNLIIVGLQTEYCIDATIKSAFEKGYKVYVPLGTNSTFDNNYLKAKKAIKYYNEWIWDGAFAEVISVGDAIKLFKQK